MTQKQPPPYEGLWEGMGREGGGGPAENKPLPPKNVPAPPARPPAILAKEEKHLTHFPARQDGANRQVLTLDQVRYLIEWARNAGLDAWKGHVCMYYGKPYVTISGRLANAFASGQFAYMNSWRANKDEKAELGYAQEDKVFFAEVKRRDMERPVQCWGVVTDQEVKQAIAKSGQDALYLPIVKSPQHLAEKRALARALDRAFPLGLPGEEEAAQEEAPAPLLPEKGEEG